MPASRTRGVLPRRRRRDEDGEDESSNAGDLDDFSLSEGSASSNGDEDADVEGSEVSADDGDNKVAVPDTRPVVPLEDKQPARSSPLDDHASLTTTPEVDTLAATNGLPKSNAVTSDRSLQDEVGSHTLKHADEANMPASEVHRPQETATERSRREHLEYNKQRSSNPAFVPNRGGFFLHDDRGAALTSPYGRPFARGRGRGYNPSQGAGRGFGAPVSGPTDRQWAHDLHETVNKTAASPPTLAPAPYHIPTAKAAPVAPNRTFSISTVLGNVTVQVALPGMTEKKTFQNLVKRQHTLLPQHRPPLRRDKPVRISIPAVEPRYIFPSTERSFIFIPRAMRPNQQIYTRGRGRGSFHGSRRASIIGSAHTPSVAMSRKSSIGGAGSTGLHTPTDATFSRGPMMANFNRPVVRMPAQPPMFSNMPVPMPIDPNNFGPIPLHSPAVTLPMHQPRPQKQVSVAEIESPAVKAPQQQQEQPFHQQMPPGVSLVDGPTAQQGQSQPNVAIGTPLSHIPEGAVYAQPFQPYPVYPQSGYYGPAFPGGPMVYHNAPDLYAMGMGMGGPVLAPQFAPGRSFGTPPRIGEAAIQPGAMAHESSGMVYYYDPNQYAADGSHMAAYQMGVGGGMMVTAPGAYYYPAVPNGMFYPSAQQ